MTRKRANREIVFVVVFLLWSFGFVFGDVNHHFQIQRGLGQEGESTFVAYASVTEVAQRSGWRPSGDKLHIWAKKASDSRGEVKLGLLAVARKPHYGEVTFKVMVVYDDATSRTISGRLGRDHSSRPDLDDLMHLYYYDGSYSFDVSGNVFKNAKGEGAVGIIAKVIWEDDVVPSGPFEFGHEDVDELRKVVFCWF